MKEVFDKEFIEVLEAVEKEYPGVLDSEGIGKQLNINNFSKSYYGSYTSADTSVDANSNVTSINVITYMREATKPLHKLNSLYLLWKQVKKDTDLATATQYLKWQLLSRLYTCDLHGASSLPYCYNYSTLDLAQQGLSPVDKVRCVPPKYLFSFKSQLEQFVIIASNSTLGATGLSDMFITMSLYVDKILETKKDASFTFATDDDIWNYVKETLVSFIYTINQPMRGEQSAFTNVSVYDKYFLEANCPNYELDGKTPTISTVQKIQEIFLDCMNDELKRTPLTFPVTTACFSIDGDNNIQDEEFLDLIAHKNKDFGFINIFCGDTSVNSACCRLRSNNVNEYFNSVGASASKIGSLGVVTINLPQLAFRLTEEGRANIDVFLEELKPLIDMTGVVNNARRNIILNKVAIGAHPLYSLGFIDIKKQYSTTGVIGLYEALQILGYDILTDRGQDACMDILEFINNCIDELQAKYKYPHNVEQVPGENMSVKLANKDKLLGYNDEYAMYSNQFIPLVVNTPLANRIKLQGMFDSLFSGGAIMHLNLENVVDAEVQKTLIRTSAKRGVVYFAINLRLCECEHGHVTSGARDKCPVCGGKIINEYTRVVGFLTNTKNWIKERREFDYPNRKFYDSMSNDDFKTLK